MEHLNYRLLTNNDLEFISNVYEENIQALHGNKRTIQMWKEIINNENQKYYIVYNNDNDVAWFRLDVNEKEFELGMLQVHPLYQHQGIGKYIIKICEDIAKENNFNKIIIHTTSDNIKAQNLYSSSKYNLVEVGPCTTADGQERIGHTYEKII